MKTLQEYLQINEVSKELARRAYNKATGAQKNRIKKLYKEIYGSDISKKDISEINFYIDNEDLEKQHPKDVYIDLYADDTLKEEFALWDQKILNNIKYIEIITDGKTDYKANLLKYKVFINIKENSKEDNFYAIWKYDTSYGAYGYLEETNIDNFEEDDYLDIRTMIAYIYKQLQKNNI